jgi:hypothetical protein
MKKLLKFCVLKIKYIVLIYIALQLVLIFTQNITYKSDALYYYSLAEKCLQQNEFYPYTYNLNDDYIIGIYRYIKNPLNDKTINLILIYSLITIMIIMITVGAPRYKYPIFILLLPFAASYLALKFRIDKTIEK